MIETYSTAKIDFGTSRAVDTIHSSYQNLQSRFGIERYAYTDSYIGQIPCVCICMYVCMYVCDQTPPKQLNRFA